MRCSIRHLTAINPISSLTTTVAAHDAKGAFERIGFRCIAIDDAGLPAFVNAVGPFVGSDGVAQYIDVRCVAVESGFII